MARADEPRHAATNAGHGGGGDPGAVPRGGGVTRRDLLERAAATAGSLSLAGLLAACGSGDGGGGGGGGGGGAKGPGGLPLARPDSPVTLPLYPDNKAIASGLPPEKGPLQFYNWEEYINPEIVKDFERKHGVKVQITNFATIDEAVAKLASGAVQFDVFVPEVVFLSRLVAGKLVQPLNLSYIPNLKANVWPRLQDPWYDQRSRYTVPYTVYSTGIGWRADKLPGFDPAKFSNPWSALWQVDGLVGKVGMLDDQHEGLAMALLHTGVTDVNTEDRRALTKARDELIRLVKAKNLKFTTNAYQRLPEGSLWLHQAWSGDVAVTPAYLPKGTPASVMRYWWPSNGRGPINNDMLAVLKGAKNPVLAHMFLNHVLDQQVAFKNYTYIYYQQPLTEMTPELILERDLVPPNLRSTIIRQSQFEKGFVHGPLSQDGSLAWQEAWAAVKSA